jgi:hypothetical protein
MGIITRFEPDCLHAAFWLLIFIIFTNFLLHCQLQDRHFVVVGGGLLLLLLPMQKNLTKLGFDEMGRRNHKCCKHKESSN